jgi:signal transduction histidine kinase
MKKRLVPLSVMLWCATVIGLAVVGARFVASEREVAHRVARDTLRAKAVLAASRLAERIADYERAASYSKQDSQDDVRLDTFHVSQDRVLTPREPVAAIDLTPVRGRDPEGDFLLADAERREREGDRDRALAALGAAAFEGRDEDVRLVATARSLALRRRAAAGDADEVADGGELDTAARDFLARTAAHDPELVTRWRSALLERSLLEPAERELRDDLLRLVGGPDETLAVALLARDPDAVLPLAQRRADLALLPRLREIAAGLRAGEVRILSDGPMMFVAVAKSDEHVAITRARLAADWPNEPGIALRARSAGRDDAADPKRSPSTLVATAPAPSGLEGFEVIATADAAPIESAANHRTALATLILALVLLAGSSAFLMLRRALAREAQAAAAKSAFLARVGHDLRTPLALIRMYAETIASGRVEDPTETRDFAAIATREAERMSRLVDDVLDLSRVDRIDAGDPAAARVRAATPLDLAAIARDVAAAHRPLFERAGLELVLGIPAGSIPIVGDDLALRGALGNLLENALCHAGNGGKVELAVRAAITHALAVVRDRGDGVPEAALESIFARFTRGDGAKGRGLGLGLAVVREVSIAHGGGALARNRPGGGLEVEIRLPLAARSPVANLGAPSHGVGAASNGKSAARNGMADG